MPTRLSMLAPPSNGLLRVAAVASADDLRRAGDVRQQLQPVARADPVDTVQIAETRCPALLGARHERPEHAFVARRHPTLDVEPPHLRAALVESQLRERNPELRRPPVFVHRRARLPHGIESRVVRPIVVAGVVPVEAHARRGDAERVRSASIQIRVERDQKVLGLIAFVAPSERRLNRRAGSQARPHIQRVPVVHELHAHLLSGRRPLGRLFLPERRQRRRGSPALFVQLPVEPDRAFSHTNRARLEPSVRSRQLGGGGSAGQKQE
jgi:hypothetical protein